MNDNLKPMPLQFWRSPMGREPTRDWFRALANADRKVVGTDLRRVQYGWPIGMPLVKSLGNGLWELRSSLPSRREARAIFIVDSHGILVLNAFIKKSQKAPKSEIELAQKRMKEGIYNEN